MKFLSEKKLVITFSLLLVSIIISVSFAYRSYNEYLRKNSLVAHTTQVIKQADEVLSTTKDIETGARGYFISGDSSFLTPFVEALKVEKERIALLQQLTSDNPAQHQRVESLRIITTRRRMLALELIESKRSSDGYITKEELTIVKHGRDCMDSVRGAVAAIKAEENHILLQRQKQNQGSIDESRNTFLMMLFIFIVLLIVSVILIYQYLQLAKKENKLIKNSNRSLLDTVKQNKEELAVSQSQYYNLFKNMLHGFAYCKVIYEEGEAIDFEYISVNKVFEDAVGLSKITGKRVSDFRPNLRRDESGYLQIVGRVSTSGKSEHHTFYAKSLNRWLALAVYCPEPGYFITLVDNITDQKNAEIQLKKNESRFRALIENNNDIITMVDNSFVTFYVSPSTQRITGYAEEEMLNKIGTITIHPDDEEKSKQIMAEVLANPGKPVDVLVRNQHKLGHYIWMEGVITNLLHDENIGAIITNFRDVTERVEVKARLEASEKRFRSLIENSSDVITLCDEKLVPFYRSPSAARITGYEMDERKAASIESLTHPDDVEYLASTLQTVLKNPGVPCPFTYRFIHKSGQYKWLEGVFVNMLQDENVKGIILNFRDVTERKELEEKRKESEYNLKAIFENTSEGFLMIDTNSVVKAFNSKANEIALFNTENSLQVGKPFYNFIAPERARVIKPLVKKALEGEHVQFDRLYENPEGDLWINYSLNPVIANGEVQGICISGTDITGRKKTEEALKRALERLFFDMENSPFGFIEWNDKLGVKSFSSRTEDIFGWTQEEYNNRLAEGASFVYEEDRMIAARNAVNLISGKVKRNQAHYRIQHKDGRLIWCEWFNSVMKDNNGKVITIMSLVRDITDQKRAEERLRLSNERFLTLSHETNDPIWDWNLVTDEVFWNESFYNVFDYDSSDPIPGVNEWAEKIHPDDREKVVTRLSRIRKNIVDSWVDEFRVQMPDGSYSTMIDRARVIRDDEGNPVRVIGTFMDITERKQAEEKLMQLNTQLNSRAEELSASNAELEQFAYIASHDLQEPLRMVTSFLSLLEKKYKPQLDETAGKYIWFAEDGATRMRRIILDLLEYSRVGKKDYESEMIDSNDMLDEIIQLNSTIIEEKQAVINRSNLPVLNIARTPIQQVLQNLVSNALKYQPEGTKPVINVRARAEAKQWEFSVSDNDLGIEPAFFQKIFVLFQRLHTKDEYSGTGIGLSICKKIIENHNGKIWVESIPGEGSTFFFTIPQEQLQ